MIKIILLIVLIIILLISILFLIRKHFSSSSSQDKLSGSEINIDTISKLLDGRITFKYTSDDMYNMLYLLCYNKYASKYYHNIENEINKYLNNGRSDDVLNAIITSNDYGGLLRIINTLNKNTYNYGGDINNEFHISVIETLKNVMTTPIDMVIIDYPYNEHLTEIKRPRIIPTFGYYLNYIDIENYADTPENLAFSNNDAINNYFKKKNKYPVSLNETICECVDNLPKITCENHYLRIPDDLFVNTFRCNYQLSETTHGYLNYFESRFMDNVFCNCVYKMSENEINNVNRRYSKFIGKYRFISSDLHGKFMDLIHLLIQTGIIEYKNIEEVGGTIYHKYNIVKYKEAKKLIYLGDLHNYKLLNSESHEYLTYHIREMYRLIYLINKTEKDTIIYIRGNHDRCHLYYLIVFCDLNAFSNAKVFTPTTQDDNDKYKKDPEMTDDKYITGSFTYYMEECLTGDDQFKSMVEKFRMYIRNFNKQLKSSQKLFDLIGLLSSEYVKPLRRKIAELVHDFSNAMIDLIRANPDGKYINLFEFMDFDALSEDTRFYLDKLTVAPDYLKQEVKINNDKMLIYFSHENLLDQYLNNWRWINAMHIYFNQKDKISAEPNKSVFAIDDRHMRLDTVLGCLKFIMFDTEIINSVTDAVNHLQFLEMKTKDDKFYKTFYKSFIESYDACILNQIQKSFKNSWSKILNIHGHIGATFNLKIQMNRLSNINMYEQIFKELDIHPKAGTCLPIAAYKDNELIAAAMKLKDANKILNSMNELSFKYVPFSMDVTYLGAHTDKYNYYDFSKTIGNVGIMIYDDETYDGKSIDFDICHRYIKM